MKNKSDSKANLVSKTSPAKSSAVIIYLSLGTAMLAALSTGVYLYTDQASTPVVASVQSGVQTPIRSGKNTAEYSVDGRQIELAMSAYKAGKLVAPAGENALELYLAALQSKPDDFGAQEAVMELVPVAMSALESAMAASAALEVERLLSLLERADPSAARVAALKQRWQSNLAQQASAAAAASSLASLQTAQVNAVQEIKAPETAAVAVTAIPVPPVAVAKAASAKRATVATIRQNQVTQTSLKPTLAAAQNHIVEARALSTARAVFPALARRQKIEGWVDLQVAIDANGRVTEALVLSAQPARIFDVEARRAVLRWRYSPRRVNDQPVSSVLRQRIKFSLTS